MITVDDLISRYCGTIVEIYEGNRKLYYGSRVQVPWRLRIAVVDCFDLFDNDDHHSLSITIKRMIK